MKTALLTLFITVVSSAGFSDQCYNIDPKSKAKLKVQPNAMLYKDLDAAADVDWIVNNKVLGPFSSVKFVRLGDEEFGDKIVIIKTIALKKVSQEWANTRVQLNDQVQEDKFIDCQVDDQNVYLLKTIVTWSDICQEFSRKDKNENKINFLEDLSGITSLENIGDNWEKLANVLDKTNWKASGSFGKLWIFNLAGKDVAIKRAALSRNKIEEVRLLKDMTGKGISPGFYSCAFDGAELYIIQEKMWNTLSASEFITFLQPKNVQERAKFYADILNASVKFLKAGYVHFDIKPDNIMLNMDMQPRLIDFGFSVQVNTIDHDQATKKYRSPLRVKDQPVNPLSDTFALVLTIISIEGKIVNIDAFARTLKVTVSGQKADIDWAKTSTYDQSQRAEIFKHFETILSPNWDQISQQKKNQGVQTLTSLFRKVFVDLDPNVTTEFLQKSVAKLGRRVVV